jgi:hypothetical protein
MFPSSSLTTNPSKPDFSLEKPDKGKDRRETKPRLLFPRNCLREFIKMSLSFEVNAINPLHYKELLKCKNHFFQRIRTC